MVAACPDGSPRALPSAQASCVLRLRGLPFTACQEEVRAFFQGHELEETYLCKRDGRLTGEAYVVLKHAADAEAALTKLQKKYIGSRYIELFEATQADLAAVKKVLEDARFQGFVVRLRGLPYQAREEDVREFFDGVHISDAPEAQPSIVFAQSVDGRPTGEAYVELADEQALALAMTRHKELMGTRYIEIFNSSKVDKLQAQQQQAYHMAPAPGSRRWMPAYSAAAGMRARFPLAMPQANTYAQPAGGYVHQAPSGFVQQPAAGYVQMPASGYVQQQAGGFMQQQAGGYMQQQLLTPDQLADSLQQAHLSSGAPQQVGASVALQLPLASGGAAPTSPAGSAGSASFVAVAASGAPAVMASSRMMPVTSSAVVALQPASGQQYAVYAPDGMQAAYYSQPYVPQGMVWAGQGMQAGIRMMPGGLDGSAGMQGMHGPPAWDAYGTQQMGASFMPAWQGMGGM